MPAGLTRSLCQGLLAIIFGVLTDPATAQTPPPARGVCQYATPAPIGAWCFVVEKDRPVAMAISAKSDINIDLEGIRIECAAGGRLEYVPIALRFKPWKELWLQGVDDVEFNIPLFNHRVRGADNTLLSKQFLASEANYVRNGSGGSWTMSMSLDGPDKGVAEIRMAGFGKVRTFMLEACRS